MRTKLVIIFFASLFLCVNLSNAQVKTFTGSDSVITVSKGESFNITLTSNPSTGYSWHISSIDNDMIKNAGKEYKGSEDHKMGSAGEETWHFEALQKGETRLILFYSRSFDITDKDKPLIFTIT